MVPAMITKGHISGYTVVVMVNAYQMQCRCDINRAYGFNRQMLSGSMTCLCNGQTWLPLSPVCNCKMYKTRFLKPTLDTEELYCLPAAAGSSAHLLLLSVLTCLDSFGITTFSATTLQLGAK